MLTFVFPGQGSQKKGMGKELFDQFGELIVQADKVLGYSIKELCLENPENQLSNTKYTQPALYVVNALSYFERIKRLKKLPDYVAGHSLGEYNALLAAEIFDFETGLKIVKKRGELMSRIKNGSMAAVIGLKEKLVNKILHGKELADKKIDIANYNSPTQIVISGLKKDIVLAKEVFKDTKATFFPLPVSAAFHSRYMQSAQDEFKEFLNGFDLKKLTIPVISNIKALPYIHSKIKENLTKHFTNPVKWTDSVRYLMAQGELNFEEIGPGKVLTKFIEQIKKETKPLSQEKNRPYNKKRQAAATQSGFTADSIGNKEFKNDYNLKYAYVAGAMYKGIASTKLVIKLGKAGLMGYFGTGGLDFHQVEKAIRIIKKELNHGEPYGMNLICNLKQPEKENGLVELFLKHKIRNIEASAYMQITPPVVLYRLKGLYEDKNGQVCCSNKIMAKISRPEVAQEFLSPISKKIVDKLLKEGKISEYQAHLSKNIPLADDLSVESDSGGHTDRGVAFVLVPSIIRLRDELTIKYAYAKRVRVGAAGGIGTPDAAAAAFILGADFIVTGSINQCTVEAGNSDIVKDYLQEMDIQDTEYAPSAELFELGAKVQVIKKGSFFPVRANKLYDMYRLYNSLDDIDHKTRKQIQDKFFKRSFEEVYSETKEYYLKENPLEIENAEKNAKHKMALVFKWYLAQSTRFAMEGIVEQKIDFQIHSGPALGAFNQWVKGTTLEDWKNRHVDEIAEKLMQSTAELLNNRLFATSN